MEATPAVNMVEWIHRQVNFSCILPAVVSLDFPTNTIGWA